MEENTELRERLTRVETQLEYMTLTLSEQTRAIKHLMSGYEQQRGRLKMFSILIPTMAALSGGLLSIIARHYGLIP